LAESEPHSRSSGASCDDFTGALTDNMTLPGRDDLVDAIEDRR
jgi:hypothetical protein